MEGHYRASEELRLCTVNGAEGKIVITLSVDAQNMHTFIQLEQQNDMASKPSFLTSLYNRWAYARSIVIPIANLIGFSLVVIMNSLGSAGVFGKGTVGNISDRNSTEIVPAGYAFSVWGLIYALQALYLLIQLPFICLGRSPRKVCSGTVLGGDNYLLFERIGFWSTLGHLFNSIWIIVFVFEQLWPSLVFIVLLFITVAISYFRAGVSYGRSGQTRMVRDEINPSEQRRITVWEYWCIQPAFSIYMGWLTVATFLNIFITWKYTFITSNPTLARLGWTEQYWSVFCQGLAFCAVGTLTVWKQDFVYAGVVSWALFGIAAKHFGDSYESVKTSAFLLASLSAILSIGSFLYCLVVRVMRWREERISAFKNDKLMNKQVNPQQVDSYGSA